MKVPEASGILNYRGIFSSTIQGENSMSDSANDEIFRHIYRWFVIRQLAISGQQLNCRLRERDRTVAAATCEKSLLMEAWARVRNGKMVANRPKVHQSPMWKKLTAMLGDVNAAVEQLLRQSPFDFLVHLHQWIKAMHRICWTMNKTSRSTLNLLRWIEMIRMRSLKLFICSLVSISMNGQVLHRLFDTSSNKWREEKWIHQLENVYQRC